MTTEAAPRGRSLSFRLVVLAAGWTTGALLAAAFLLSSLFEDAILRNFDARLIDQLDELLVAVEVGPGGRPRLVGEPVDPRFGQPLSGRYWQVSEQLEDSGVWKSVLRSRSLWDEDLLAPHTDNEYGVALYEAPGPDGQALRLIGRHVTLPGSGAAFAFMIGADMAGISDATYRFNVAMAWSLFALGLGLIGSVLVQVWFGLKPLRRMQSALAGIRAGRDDSMTGEWPSELTPIVGELNALIDHNAQTVERARTHVGNLAHALKTPLSVLTNEAASGKPGARTVAQQAAIMRRHVDHYLARARTAATGGLLGARTPVGPVLGDLARTLVRIHREKQPDIAIRGDGAAVFRGEKQDLEEMLGNLMDNACKWSAGHVAVDVSTADGRLRIVVSDDGPGLPPERRNSAMKRGQRLDEGVPGSGLGLSIVGDIAGLYGGGVTLEDAELGGLAVIVDLPAAETGPAAAG